MENTWNTELLVSQRLSSTGELFWIEIGRGWITYTFVVLSLVFALQFTKFQIVHRFLLLFRNQRFGPARHSNNPIVPVLPSSQQHRISDIITDLDLKLLMDNLDEIVNENEKWERVVDRRNDSLSYHVKCCKPKDGSPLKYLSTTEFKFCSPETLRDFYMDNSYRKEWDKTLIDHMQLQVDESNGTEIGRTIKKFPLLTPREYVVAWRLWEGRDKTYYCYSKECEHPLAPRQKKFVRVGLFRSGWRIREGGRNSWCEIKMVHQEDAGLNSDMAKVIFGKGIWSYVCKMDNALRKYSYYSSRRTSSPWMTVSAITLVQKVPPSLELDSDIVTDSDRPHPQVSQEKKLSSRKLIANGLILLVGGIICLARGHPKVALAYVSSKLLPKRCQNNNPCSS